MITRAGLGCATKIEGVRGYLWDDILCRTKLAVKTDAKALLEDLDWKTFGNHRVAFYGDHRERIKDLAKFIGFEVYNR